MNTEKSIKLFGLWSLLIFVNSCSYIYFPTKPVVVNDNKKNIGVEASIGNLNGQISAWCNIDTNFFVTSQMYVGLNLFSTFSSFLEIDRSNSSALLLGGGYKNSISKTIKYQFQAGLGRTNSYGIMRFIALYNPDQHLIYEFNYKSNRFYAQPSISFINKKKIVGISRNKFEFFIIPRVVYENYYYAKRNGENTYTTKININRIYTDLFFTSRIYTNYCNLDLYFGLSNNASEGKYLYYLDNETRFINYGIGISRTFNY